MKLSVDSGIVVNRFGIEKAMDIIKAAGFDCVDFGLTHTEIFGENYKERAKEVRAYLDKTGLVCNQAHAPFGYRVNQNTMTLSDPIYSSIVKSMEIAKILGAEHIIVHPISPLEGDTVLNVNYHFYKSLEQYAKEIGIKIAIENIFGKIYDEEQGHYIKNRFETPEEMLEIHKMLNSEHFVTCVDTGHCVLSGAEPEDYIRGLDNKALKALHIQDTFYTSEDVHTLPYLGKIRWDEVMNALCEIGYDGTFTFELFGFINKFEDALIPDALRLIEAVGRKMIATIEKV